MNAGRAEQDGRGRGGATWMTYSYVVGFGLQGVYFLALARSLGAMQFGVFSGALALAMILSTAAGLGAGHLMVIAVSRDRTAFGRQFGVFLVYLALTFLPLAIVGVILGSLAGPDFLLVVAPLLVSELIFTRTIDFTFQVFQAHDRLAVTANLNVLVALLRLVSITLVMLFGEVSASGWALVYSGVNVVFGTVLIVIVWRKMGSPAWDRRLALVSWRTGIFFSLGMSSRVVYTDGDKYLLNALGRVDVAGQYSAASRLVNLAFAPVQAIVYSSNTALFRAGAAGYRAIRPTVLRIVKRGLVLACAASVALFLCAPLLPMLLGEDYASAADMLRMISGIPVLMAVHLTFGDALMGVGRQSIRATAQAVMAGVAIVMNLLLIPVLGIGGAVISLYLVHCGLLIVNVGAFAIGVRSERHP